MPLRLIGLAVLLLFPSQLDARVVRWEGKALSVLISTDRLTRIEFPEPLRSAFLSRSDISIEKEDRSLYLRALLPDTQDTLFVPGVRRDLCDSAGKKSQELLTFLACVRRDSLYGHLVRIEYLAGCGKTSRLPFDTLRANGAGVENIADLSFM